MLLNRGANLFRFSKEVFGYTKSILIDNYKTSKNKKEALRVAALMTQWLYLSTRLMAHASFNRNLAGSAAVDYLMYSGYVTMAYHWLRMMEVSAQKLASGTVTGSDVDFYRGKILTGKFYFDRLLPRTKSLASTMLRSPDSLMKITNEEMSA